MAAGGQGDHPLTDIVKFNREVYNPACDELIRQITKLVSMDRLYEMFPWIDYLMSTESQYLKFERILKETREQLIIEAIKNGWEIE